MVDWPFRHRARYSLHFLDGHVAVFEACEALDPGNVLVVKDAAVPGIPFDAREQGRCCSKILGFHRQGPFAHRLLFMG